MVSAQTGSLFMSESLKELFLIYINDLSDKFKSNAKLFADDTSLFSVVKNKEESASDLRNDLDTISHGHITAKCHSIQTPKNQRKRYCF